VFQVFSISDGGISGRLRPRPRDATAAVRARDRAVQLNATNVARPLLSSIVTVSYSYAKTGVPQPGPNWCSGVIINKWGLILANLPADPRDIEQITVRFADRSQCQAELLSVDRTLNLAQLRVRLDQPLNAVSLAKVVHFSETGNAII